MKQLSTQLAMERDLKSCIIKLEIPYLNKNFFISSCNNQLLKIYHCKHIFLEYNTLSFNNLSLLSCKVSGISSNLRDISLFFKLKGSQISLWLSRVWSCFWHISQRLAWWYLSQEPMSEGLCCWWYSFKQIQIWCIGYSISWNFWNAHFKRHSRVSQKIILKNVKSTSGWKVGLT